MLRFCAQREGRIKISSRAGFLGMRPGRPGELQGWFCMWCYGVHLCLKQRDDRDDGRGDRADDGSGRAVALLGGRRGHRLGAGRVVFQRFTRDLRAWRLARA